MMHQRLFLLLAVVFLAGCESSPVATTAARSGSSGASFAQSPNERPGLGTKWGEDRTSRARWEAFARANSNFPTVNATIRYDDLEGIRAMIGHTSLMNRAIDLPAYGGSARISGGLQDDRGDYLPIGKINGRIYVVGEAGRRYQIVVRNNGENRVEAVLSVDGLDVMDGRRASFKKGGYILRPHERLVVDGFRQSMDKVAAFRFGSVRESYAHQKYHNSSNVGVIGIAVFDERGTDDPRREKEAKRRLNAQPFATPVY
jgi:hypothetical protein